MSRSVDISLRKIRETFNRPNMVPTYEVALDMYIGRVQFEATVEELRRIATKILRKIGLDN